MDKIRLKLKLQNYVIKGICSKKKQNIINCSLIRQVFVLLLLLTLNIIIFILIYSKKKIKNNLLKIDKRKLEEYNKMGYSDSDPDIDTEIDTIYDTAQVTTFDSAEETSYDTAQDTVYNATQDSTYLTDVIAETIIGVFKNCTK